MPDILCLMDCDSEFLTRRQGERIRERLMAVYGNRRPGERIVVDFSGVEIMTPSFADECFGKFAEAIGALNFRSDVSLVEADETVKSLVNAVLSERMSRSETEPG